MRKHVGILVLAAVVVLLLIVYTVAYEVPELNGLVVVTRFGNPSTVLSGRDPNQAGLHFKWLYPVDEEVVYDARTHVMEGPLEETQTHDRKPVNVSVFCAWRIEDAPRFLATIKGGSTAVLTAEDKVKIALRDATAQVVGLRDLSELINTDPASMKLADVEADIAKTISPRLHDDFGIGVVMVGIKRLGLPKDVTATVIDAMKAERKEKASEYESGGEARANAIRARARAASEKILSFAKAKALDIHNQGDLAAAEYLQKFRGHEDLALFLRQVDALKTELSGRAIMLMDETMMPMLGWFRTPPSPASLKQMATSGPSGGTVPAEAPAADRSGK